MIGSASVLFEPGRHEPLTQLAWDESRARALIARIAADAAARFLDGLVRPVHPRDGAPARELHGELYHGAGGVLWALHHLDALGATGARIDSAMVDATLRRHRDWQASFGGTEFASYLISMADAALSSMRSTASPALPRWSFADAICCPRMNGANGSSASRTPSREPRRSRAILRTGGRT